MRPNSFGPAGTIFPMREKPWLLVVDDAPPMLHLVKELLTPAYLVDTAGGVAEARARLAGRAYDLVLTDMVMPEAGGMDLVQYVRLHHPEVPTIVLTGYANFQDAVQAVKLGAFDYLTKPIQADILRHAIRRALEFRRLTQVERELEVIFQGAEALGWQALDLLTDTPEAAILASLKDAVQEGGELAPVARRFLTGAQDLVQATRCSIFLYDAGRNQFHGLAATGPDAQAREAAQVPISDGIMGQMANHHRPLLVADLDLDQRFAYLPRRYMYHSRSFMIIPLRGSRFWGVINLTDRPGGSFSARELFLGWLLGRLFVEVLESREPKAELATLPVMGAAVPERLPLGVALLDRDLRAVQASPSLLRLAGQGQASLAAGELLSLLGLSPQDAGLVIQTCGQVLADREPRECAALKSILNPHMPRHLDFKLVPASGPEADPLVVLLVEDVSERENLRQRLQLYEHLAIMGKLSLCVAHELNNPLDGIRRYLSLAQRKKDEPREVERYLGEAQKGLQKMSLTIRSLLSSANPLTPPRATDSILTLLQDAVKILMFQASDQRVEVTCLPPPDLAHTRAEGDLYHVFVNLIKNALQSMPQGGSLRIDGRLDESQVEVAFEDTGPGLSPQEQNHIFLPFYTTKGEGQGLGLGLPICRKILERYQGQLLVESRAGQGTRVRVILPRKSMGGNHAV